MSSLQGYRSPALRGMTRRRSPSPPSVKPNYGSKERAAWNNILMSNVPEEFRAARRSVAQKMAQGKNVSMEEKRAAGIVEGGRKRTRKTKKTRRGKSRYRR